MIVDESKYIWSKWQQPVFENNDSWGVVSATSTHMVEGADYEPYHALDGNLDSHWESADYELEAQFQWVFDKPLKIYRIELINKPSSSVFYSKGVEVYADEEMSELLLSGTFPTESKGKLNLEPEVPFSCDRIVLKLTTENRYIGLTDIRIIAEVGQEKTVLIPFLDTTENMEYVSNGYNDDGTYSTEGRAEFYFNGITVPTLYISSNLWFGFGTSAEQLQVLRRDGCSTAIYRQTGVTTNGLEFLKIRFEGYTVYNNRVDANRVIFELFLLSNNDMFLNVIQTPTSGNIGTSNLICNGKTTPLTLSDGSGGGCMVSFYHQDDLGKEWTIVYAMYEETDTFSYAYLIREGDIFYTITENEKQEIDITELTAAMFLKYGFEETPTSEVLAPLTCPQVYLWKAGGTEEVLKANVKAYPYPQTLESVVDMSHISILGIKLLTAEYSGQVGLQFSLDNGATFSEEVELSEWLNTDPEELWNSLNETKILILHFILHDDAAISRFKITYIN